MTKTNLLLSCALLSTFACIPAEKPCDYSGDEVGETGVSSEDPQVCENSNPITINDGFVFCGSPNYDETLEHLTDASAASFGMPDYLPFDGKGYSAVAIVDGREPGPVASDDYRAFVEAVVSYEDPELGTRMGMMGRVCCPDDGWYVNYPDDFGDAASPQCQNAFGDGNIYPNAYCLPMPDARWPHNNVVQNYQVPPTGGLCVYFCNDNTECPGYGLGLQTCEIITFEGEVVETPVLDSTGKVGVCKNVNYLENPTPLEEGEPLKVHLEEKGIQF